MPRGRNWRTPDDALQFDHADFTAAPAVTACGRCRQPIRDVYYEIQGKVLCGPCRDQVVAHFAGGSEPARFVRQSVRRGGALAGAAAFRPGGSVGRVAIVPLCHCPASVG